MRKRDVDFIAVKRKNMVKSDEEAEYYGFLSRVRKKSKPSFSCRKLLKFMAVSKRGQAVKIILGLLAFNFYQLMG